MITEGFSAFSGEGNCRLLKGEQYHPRLALLLAGFWSPASLWGDKVSQDMG